MLEQLEDMEGELLAVRRRMGEYEAGTYGLSSAVSEIKSCRAELARKDTAIARRTEKVAVLLQLAACCLETDILAVFIRSTKWRPRLKI